MLRAQNEPLMRSLDKLAIVDDDNELSIQVVVQDRVPRLNITAVRSPTLPGLPWGQNFTLPEFLNIISLGIQEQLRCVRESEKKLKE